MKRATTSALKDQMSARLRLVQSGESNLLTEHGTPTARIVPVAPRAQAAGESAILGDEARLARLERAGVIVRGSAGSDLDSPWQPLRAGTGVLNALLEERSDESREGYR